MNHTRLWTSATIIAGLIIGGFVLSVPHTRDLPRPETAASEVASPPTVTIRDVYKKGVHTISGSLMVPNVCASVTAAATLDGSASSTPSILVSITVTPDEEICLQVPARATFSTSVVASPDLPLEVTVNGGEASTTEA